MAPGGHFSADSEFRCNREQGEQDQLALRLLEPGQNTGVEADKADDD